MKKGLDEGRIERKVEGRRQLAKMSAHTYVKM